EKLLMRLTADVYLVGGGSFAFDMSSPFDCHVYAIRSGDEVALIDVGTGLERESIVENMKEDGLDPADVSQIFVTHYHTDHAGGLAEWRELTGARVYASVGSTPAIASGDANAIGLEAAQRGGFYPADYVFRPCPIDVELEGGETLRIGDLTLTPHNSPGHCHGHLVYHLSGTDRSYLFSGDCLFHGGTIILQNIPDCNIPEYAATMERLSALEFDALLPGHLSITLRNGKRHVDVAANAFRSLGLPRQAIQL
ncbi:MAG TPA: MBL fold metallo-hydrolase, partial [Acidimicrobiia bacterium]|nr:MBL fold metallo-hydrolase [Acidimicrobiia bacterium]